LLLRREHIYICKRKWRKVAESAEDKLMVY
jgi:hypothetical protein